MSVFLSISIYSFQHLFYFYLPPYIFWFLLQIMPHLFRTYMAAGLLRILQFKIGKFIPIHLRPVPQSIASQHSISVFIPHDLTFSYPKGNTRRIYSFSCPTLRAFKTFLRLASLCDSVLSAGGAIFTHVTGICALMLPSCGCSLYRLAFALNQFLTKQC